MFFLALTDQGVITQPFQANDLASAADAIRQQQGQGADGSTVKLALLDTTAGA